MNASLSNSVQDYSDYDGSSTSNVWYSAQFVSPLFPVYVKGLDGKNVLGEDGKSSIWIMENGRQEAIRITIPVGGLTDDKSNKKNDVASLRTGVTFGSDKDNFGGFPRN